MPFGLTNARNVFHRVVQQTVMGLDPESGLRFVAIYNYW